MTKTQHTWVRWLIRRDMPRVLEIENACFDQPWTEENYVDFLRHRTGIGMVAEVDGAVAGVMLYSLEKGKYHLENLAVAPELQRRGVGRVMIEKLIGKLSSSIRSKIELCIRETNLSGQKFFRQLGFQAVEVIHGLYPHDEFEDAYLMAYDITARSNRPFSSKNRITNDT